MEAIIQTANRFVRTRFGDRAYNLKPLASGDWSQAYSFLLDGHDRVIRFGAYVEDFEKDRVMGTYSSDFLPIPHVLEIGQTQSGFYAVSERVRGEHLDELDGPGICHVLPQLLDALSELQTHDLTKTQEVGIWRPNGEGPGWGTELLSVAEPRDRLAGWRESLDAWPLEAQVFDTGVEKLRQLITQLPEYRGIIHNDLLNRNVLVDGGKLSGVIDWGNARYGDPLYDIAWFLYWWSWYPEWQEIDLQEIVDDHWVKHEGKPPLADERLHCCLIHIGLDHIAYSAFKQRPEEMKRNAKQLMTYL
ncbi:phosphotransferase family protein [Paenibacillus nasutitermitis]|uniref:Aminoglycoside phosphotransferase domain-containing protein n=1 Tax=Paenibacillus nasutitermitis TaxID=1652958 RepID=A0A917DQD1_9BACL|nr:aminoglycoside phosphotransferase family protein [Paenibacillus nasutitermitis]GGD59107.1 hypothetical protein GCM10010911_16150 [Paenibacillus nasutitermitis]